MRGRMKAAMIAVGTAAMFVSGSAFAAPAADGIFFIHGTGDMTAPSSQVNPTDGTAVTSYWTQSAINSMIADPAGGNWTYGVAGYQGASKNALNSAYDVANQIHDFYSQNAAIYNIVLVTHSNGSNPVRYMMAHPTATDSRGTSYGTILGWVKRVIFVAGSNAGTPLADKVTQSGSLANIATDIVGLFGNSYNNPAVYQQVQSTMSTYNSNGTFATGTTPGGVSTYYVYGNNVYASIWSGDAWCGGYANTVGLKATQVYGWGSSSAATDGFIGVNSSTYVGTAGMSGDGRLNHQQSRRACHGVGGTIENLAHGAMGGTFGTIPSDYTISPSAQACNATWQGWFSTYYYSLGCTSGMRTDANTDIDCYVSYGGDNGYIDQWTGVNPPDGNGRSASDGWYYTMYSDSSKYGNGGAGCSDTWLGDGECDLCLVAKYGYDSASGSTADDDCVNKGAGTQNHCADITWYSPSQSLSSGSYGYYSYVANH